MTKTIFRLCLGLLFPAWLVAGNLPDEPEVEAQGNNGDIRKKLDALDEKIDELHAAKEALHREAEKAERQAEQKRELKELKTHVADVIKDMTNELTELDGEAEGEEGEGEPSAARKTFQKMFRQHLADCRAINTQIQAIQDVVFIKQARELTDQLEVLNHEWWMVKAPKYRFEIEYEAMSRHLKEEGTYQQRETLKKLRRLHEEDLLTRQKEFDSFKTRREVGKMMEKMKREIWGEED